MTDLLSIKNEVGIFCLLKGTKVAAECLKIDALDVKKFLLRCNFDEVEFFSKLSGILETTIEELGLEVVAASLSSSQNLIKLIAKDCSDRVSIYQEYQKIVTDEMSSNLDKETQCLIIPSQNKTNDPKEPKELTIFEEELKKKRIRPKSTKSVTSNPEKQPIKRPKITEINKSITPPVQNNPLDISMTILNPPIETQNIISTPLNALNPPIEAQNIISTPLNVNQTQLSTVQSDIMSQNVSVPDQTMSNTQIPSIFTNPNILLFPFLSQYSQFGYPQPSYNKNTTQSPNLVNYPAYMSLSNQLMHGNIPIQAPIQRPNPPSQRNANQNPRQLQATCTNLLLKYNIPYHTPPNGNILDPDYSYRPSNIN